MMAQRVNAISQRENTVRQTDVVSKNQVTNPAQTKLRGQFGAGQESSDVAPVKRIPLNGLQTVLANYADLLGLLVLALAVGWSFLQYDIGQQPIPGDATYHIYVAQQMWEGHPVYRDVTIVKTPLADFLVMFGLPVGRALGIQDTMTARLVFLLLSLATVVVVYFAGRVLLDSRAAGVIAALIVAGNEFFAFRAVAGPEPKTLVALFSCAVLILIAQRRWGWAGCCAALAALSWQPAAITMVLVFVAAIPAPTDEPLDWKTRERWLPLLRGLGGMAVPFLALLMYLGMNGALGAAYGSTIGANLSHFNNHTQTTPFNEILEWNAYWVVYNIDLYCIAAVERWQLVPAILGFAGIAATEAIEAVRQKRWQFNLKRTPLLLYTLGFGIFTLLDFNWCPDLYPFLPIFGLAIGWFVAVTAKGIGALAARGMDARRGALVAIALCVLATLTIVAVNLLDARAYKRIGISYNDQLALVRQVRGRFDPGDRILSIGNAIILVEMHLLNASKIIHFGSKAGRGVLDNEPGGMDGMIAALDQNPPRFVTLSRTPREDWNADFFDWVESRYRLIVHDKYNAVDVYVLRRHAP